MSVTCTVDDSKCLSHLIYAECKVTNKALAPVGKVIDIDQCDTCVMCTVKTRLGVEHTAPNPGAFTIPPNQSVTFEVFKLDLGQPLTAEDCKVRSASRGDIETGITVSCFRCGPDALTTFRSSCCDNDLYTGEVERTYELCPDGSKRKVNCHKICAARDKKAPCPPPNGKCGSPPYPGCTLDGECVTIDLLGPPPCDTVHTSYERCGTDTDANGNAFYCVWCCPDEPDASPCPGRGVVSDSDCTDTCKSSFPDADMTGYEDFAANGTRWCCCQENHSDGYCSSPVSEQYDDCQLMDECVVDFSNGECSDDRVSVVTDCLGGSGPVGVKCRYCCKEEEGDDTWWQIKDINCIKVGNPTCNTNVSTSFPAERIWSETKPLWSDHADIDFNVDCPQLNPDGTPNPCAGSGNGERFDEGDIIYFEDCPNVGEGYDMQCTIVYETGQGTNPNP